MEERERERERERKRMGGRLKRQQYKYAGRYERLVGMYIYIRHSVTDSTSTGKVVVYR